MKRFLAIALIGILVFSMLAACGTKAPASSSPASSTAAAGETQTGTKPAEPGKTWSLNLGTVANNPETTGGYNAIGKAIADFAKLANEYTGGAVTVTPGWSSTLGNNVQMFEQIMMGELDFHVGQPMSSADKRFGCWSIPFVFDSLEEVKAAFDPADGPLFALASKWMEDNDVKLLAIDPSVFRGVVSKVPVYVPADMKNMKIRTYEDALVNQFWSKVGTASIIPGSEIYAALQTKTVDAMEFHATGMMSFKLYEVASYFTDLNWQWTNGGCLTCPMKLWNSFPADIQEGIQKAATQMAEKQYEYEVADEAQVAKDLEAKGLTVIKPTAQQRQEWIDLARSMDGWFKDYVGADVFEDYMAAVQANKEAIGK